MHQGQGTTRGDLPRRIAVKGDRIAWYASAIGLERGARLGAVAIVPLFLPDWTNPRWSLLFAGLATYVLVTAFARRKPGLRAADLVVAAAVTAGSGGEVVPFLGFLVVAVAGPAAQGGVKAGLAAGGTLSTVLVVTLAISGQLPEVGLGGLLPAALMLPLVGVTTASAVQVLEDRAARERHALQEAHRLLTSLQTIAEDLPGGLDASTVAAGVIAEVRAVDGAGPVIVLAYEDGLLQPAGVAGVRPGRVQGIRPDELHPLTARAPRAHLHTAAELPTALQRACRDHPIWAVVPLGHEGKVAGALLVAFDERDAGRRARSELEGLAADAALALENVRLFDGTRVRAAAAARHRIAGDLHDGVAQSLAHLRMELELLAMASDEEDGGELGRLGRVAGTALEDLRATISGLRSASDVDLEALLARHVEDVRPAHEPEVQFESHGWASLDAVRTEDVLRIAQEALSNALRHARATMIQVTLERDEHRLELIVEDDGVGLGEASDHEGNGLGLRSMRERAERLGGDLQIRPRLGGGTVVALRCPTQQRPRHRHEARA